MNSFKLFDAFNNKKDSFHYYVNTLKSKLTVDVFSVINTTLIRNPFNTNFPKNFFLGKYDKKNKFFLFFKSALRFYVFQMYYFILYIFSFCIYSIFYKKKKFRKENYLAFDIPFLMDEIIKQNTFDENHFFTGLYDILEKQDKNYMFLPRFSSISKNPFKLIKFFRIINKDSRNFLFEFELLNFRDYSEKSIKALDNLKFFAYNSTPIYEEVL